MARRVRRRRPAARVNAGDPIDDRFDQSAGRRRDDDRAGRHGLEGDESEWLAVDRRDRTVTSVRAIAAATSVAADVAGRSSRSTPSAVGEVGQALRARGRRRRSSAGRRLAAAAASSAAIARMRTSTPFSGMSRPTNRIPGRGAPLPPIAAVNRSQLDPGCQDPDPSRHVRVPPRDLAGQERSCWRRRGRPPGRSTARAVRGAVTGPGWSSTSAPWANRTSGAPSERPRSAVR